MALNQSKSASRSPNAVGPHKSAPSVLSRVILAHGGEILLSYQKQQHPAGISLIVSLENGLSIDVL